MKIHYSPSSLTKVSLFRRERSGNGVHSVNVSEVLFLPTNEVVRSGRVGVYLDGV